jgi:hypothetical protein
VTRDVMRNVTRDVTRYVTRNGNGPVTRYGNDPDATAAAADAGRGPGPVGLGGELPAAPPREERERVRRAQNTERQRRFRRRREAARRAEAARDVTRGRNDARDALAPADGIGAARDREAPVAGSFTPAGSGHRRSGEGPPATAPVRPERDRGAEFAVWFAGYPRQEAEIPAQQVWMAEGELPPLALMLERLTAQKAAKPDAYYWLAPDRYLREKRWRDQPPPAPARAVQARSVWAQLRAMGSDEGRRQRLREISAEARFDPFDPGASRG